MPFGESVQARRLLVGVSGSKGFLVYSGSIEVGALTVTQHLGHGHAVCRRRTKARNCFCCSLSRVVLVSSLDLLL